ncbi:hypothetical protein NEOC65_001133 [Neochlamydia sp. AcF65]|nr:hypothetical protein [Neochlamydia sp. AcF65]
MIGEEIFFQAIHVIFLKTPHTFLSCSLCRPVLYKIPLVKVKRSFLKDWAYRLMFF